MTLASYLLASFEAISALSGLLKKKKYPPPQAH